MQKIKFIKSNLEYIVSLKMELGRVVCTFSSVDDAESAPLSEGFIEINEHNNVVQGNFEDYKYIYKKELDNITFILTTNENDIYVEPIKPIEPVKPEQYVPTEEEIAEQERQQKILNINNQINTLKSQLADTDYIFVKCYEASLVGESIDEYDFEILHTERQSLREQINVLEEELSELSVE